MDLSRSVSLPLDLSHPLSYSNKASPTLATRFSSTTSSTTSTRAGNIRRERMADVQRLLSGSRRRRGEVAKGDGEGKTIDSLESLPTNPKAWTPAELSTYLSHVLKLIPPQLIADIHAFVLDRKLSGRTFVSLREKDWIGMGVNTRWVRVLAQAGEGLRRACARRRLVSFDEDCLEEEEEEEVVGLESGGGEREVEPRWKASWKRVSKGHEKGRIKGMAALFESPLSQESDFKDDKMGHVVERSDSSGSSTSYLPILPSLSLPSLSHHALSNHPFSHPDLSSPVLDDADERQSEEGDQTSPLSTLDDTMSETGSVLSTDELDLFTVPLVPDPDLPLSSSPPAKSHPLESDASQDADFGSRTVDLSPYAVEPSLVLEPVAIDSPNSTLVAPSIDLPLDDDEPAFVKSRPGGTVKPSILTLDRPPPSSPSASLPSSHQPAPSTDQEVEARVQASEEVALHEGRLDGAALDSVFSRSESLLALVASCSFPDDEVSHPIRSSRATSTSGEACNGDVDSGLQLLLDPDEQGFDAAKWQDKARWKGSVAIVKKSRLREVEANLGRIEERLRGLPLALAFGGYGDGSGVGGTGRGNRQAPGEPEQGSGRDDQPEPVGALHPQNDARPAPESPNPTEKKSKKDDDWTDAGPFRSWQDLGGYVVLVGVGVGLAVGQVVASKVFGVRR